MKFKPLHLNDHRQRIHDYDNKRKKHSNKKLYTLFIFFQTIQFCTSQTNCPSEYSTTITSNATAKWVSNQDAHNQIIISEPPCYDQNNELITRICTNGTWQPSTTPKCHRLDTNGICPEHFNIIHNYCVFVTEPQVWQISAPKYSPKSFRTFHESKQFWLPIRRVVSYGPFEYASPGNDYGDIFPINVSDPRQFFSGDCLLYDPQIDKIQPENCTNYHRFVRYFPQDWHLYQCPEHCQPAGLNDFKCFCKSKNGNCRKFATINNIVDINALQRLTGNEICRINNLQQEATYINGNTWMSGSFKTNCAICETEPQEQDTEMTLSFEEKKSRLYLLVYSPENLKRKKKNEHIYCFTNADKKLKKKLDVESVFKYKSEKNKNKVPYSLDVYKVELEKYLGEYWCEAFLPNMTLIESNRILAYSKKRGNEYALRIVIQNVCKFYTCDVSKFYDRILSKTKLKALFDHYNSEIRLMHIFCWEVNNDFLDILLHVSTGRRFEVTSEYNECLWKLKHINNTDNIKIVYFRSSEYCLPEKTSLGLNWPLTKIGMAAVAEEICLMQNGIPVSRVCGGNFSHGSQWSQVIGNCAQNVSLSHITIALKELVSKSNAPPPNFWHQLLTHANLTVLDIYYLVQLLNKISQRSDSDNLALDFINKLINTNSEILKRSQEILNLTDSTLELADYLLANSSHKHDLVYLNQKQHVIVHVTNPFLSNISGLLLYGNGNSLTDCSVQNFQRFNTFDRIEKDNLQLAVYVPELILEQILNDTETNTSDVNIITTIFLNDSLFYDDRFKSTSFVISVSIPGYGSYLKSPIPILFLSNNETNKEECGFWDLGKRSKLKKGEWSVLGSNYAGTVNESNLHLCSFIHLTHFALLVMSDKKNIVDENDEILSPTWDSDDADIHFVFEIITIIGSVFSIVGILGIFLTAIFFEKWRRKIGTKILLNLSVAILLETITMQLSEINSLKQSEENCKILGIALHYFVLSTFCWMFIYAFLQYLRFVTVIGLIPKNLVLKSMFVGWAVPLIFVLCIGLTTSQSYMSSSYELCYPRGLLLYLTVLTPIALISLANLVIFCVIMYNVIYPKTTSCGNNKLFKLKLYLALLLFFVLGIPWLFGIISEIVYFSEIKLILSGIFIITGTFQGFVLFLFYVVLNKETRKFWTQYVQSIDNTTNSVPRT